MDLAPSRPFSFCPEMDVNVELWTHINAYFQKVSPTMFSKLVQRRVAMTSEYTERILTFSASGLDYEQTQDAINILLNKCEHYERHFASRKEQFKLCPVSMEARVIDILDCIISWRNVCATLAHYELSLLIDEKGISRFIYDTLNIVSPVDFTTSQYLSSFRKAIKYSLDSCCIFKNKWLEYGILDLSPLALKLLKACVNTFKYCIELHVSIVENASENISIGCIIRLWRLFYGLFNVSAYYESLVGKDELVAMIKQFGFDNIGYLSKSIHFYVVPTDISNPFLYISRESPCPHLYDLENVLHYFTGSDEFIYTKFANCARAMVFVVVQHTNDLCARLLQTQSLSTGCMVQKYSFFANQIQEMVGRLFTSRSTIFRYMKNLDELHKELPNHALGRLDNNLVSLCKELIRLFVAVCSSDLALNNATLSHNVLKATYFALHSIYNSSFAFKLATFRREIVQFFSETTIFALSSNNRDIKRTCKYYLKRCVQLDDSLLNESSIFQSMLGQLEISSSEVSCKVLSTLKITELFATIELDIDNRRRELGFAGRVLSETLSRCSSAEQIWQEESMSPGFVWQRLSKIGEGPCGTVFDAIIPSNELVIAVKEILINDSFDAVAFKTMMARIVSAKHKNLVEYFGFDRRKTSVSIIMEYCAASSLHKNLKLGPISDIIMFKSYCIQILMGLDFLHSHNFIYRNLKPENVLMNQNGCIKLSDYGNFIPIAIRNKTIVTGSSKKGNRKNLIGSPEFLAPELLIGEKFTTSSDIWSFACIMLTMITGKTPFSHLESDWSVLYNVTVCQKNPEVPNNIDDTIREIITSCLTRDLQNRPSAKKLLAHPFFSNVLLPNSE